MVPLALLNLGPWEIALIALLALLLFGGKKLPSLAKDLGTGIKEFRKSLSAASEDDSTATPPHPTSKETYSAFPEEEPKKKARAKKKS